MFHDAGGGTVRGRNGLPSGATITLTAAAAGMAAYLAYEAWNRLAQNKSEDGARLAAAQATRSAFDDRRPRPSGTEDADHMADAAKADTTSMDATVQYLGDAAEAEQRGFEAGIEAFNVLLAQEVTDHCDAGVGPERVGTEATTGISITETTQLFLENLATSATHAAPQPLVAEVLRPHPPPMDHDREMASRRMEILQRALDKLQQPLPDHDGATANAPTANTANQRAMRAAERDAAKLQTDIVALKAENEALQSRLNSASNSIAIYKGSVEQMRLRDAHLQTKHTEAAEAAAAAGPPPEAVLARLGATEAALRRTEADRARLHRRMVAVQTELKHATQRAAPLGGDSALSEGGTADHAENILLAEERAEAASAELERMRARLVEERSWREELQKRVASGAMSSSITSAHDGSESFAGMAVPSAESDASPPRRGTMRNNSGSTASSVLVEIEAALKVELSEALEAADLERQQLTSIANQLDATRKCAEDGWRAAGEWADAAGRLQQEKEAWLAERASLVSRVDQFEHLAATTIPEVADKVFALEATCATLHAENGQLTEQLMSRHSAMSNIRTSLSAAISTPPPQT